MNYNGAADFAIFELPLEVTLRVSLSYSAASETISLALTDNGVLAAPVNAVRLATNATSFTLPFTQFRVDAFAITSYSDAGQNSPFAGSLLAHGSVDNIVIKVPPPPVQDLRGEFVEARWRARFQSRARWAYRLEASADLREWQPVGGFTEGTGSVLSLGDEAGAGAQRFYRIFARRND